MNVNNFFHFLFMTWSFVGIVSLALIVAWRQYQEPEAITVGTVVLVVVIGLVCGYLVPLWFVWENFENALDFKLYDPNRKEKP